MKTTIALLLTAALIAGCSAGPGSKGGTYNSPDSQRERAKDAQDEIRRDTKGY